MFARIRARFGRGPKETPPAVVAPYGYAPAPPQGFAPDGMPPYGYPPVPPHGVVPEGAAQYGYPQAPPQGPPPGYGAPYPPVQVPHQMPVPGEHHAPDQTALPPGTVAPLAPTPFEQAPPVPDPVVPAPIEQAVPEAPEPEPVVPPSAPEVREEPITEALASLAMRDLTLVESLLDIVEDLEDTTEDPDLLDKLFKIDNLATRMRRNGENLLVLAGQDTGDQHLEAISLLDVSRAAISEIGDYERVRLGRLPELFVAGRVSDDVSHLLAELLDNATAKSPDHAQVVISAQPMTGDRLLLTVEDEGIGIPEAQLDTINKRLEGPPVLEEGAIRHMGLYVVSRIAHRHGLQVQLQARAFRGISAHVVVPSDLISTTGPKPVTEPVKPAPTPVSARPLTPPTPRVSSGDGSGPALTSAGLPRRGANRSTDPMPVLPTAEPEEPAQSEDPESRAERIRADLEGFLEGERAATQDE
ncbi:sensor histidine kinase [Actinorugispora endophytica]|nr:ATP-binding protein [Actinorugispora endophytica]